MIWKWAKNNDFIVFAHDLDFGALLAAGSSEGPSVIQVRTQNITPETIGKLVNDIFTEAIRRYLDTHQSALMEKYIRDDADWGFHSND